MFSHTATALVGKQRLENDTTKGATDVPATDPAWVKAKADADAAFAELKSHPEKFDAMARAASDETSEE